MRTITHEVTVDESLWHLMAIEYMKNYYRLHGEKQSYADAKNIVEPYYLVIKNKMGEGTKTKINFPIEGEHNDKTN